MSNFLIALLCAAAAGAWSYNRFMKTTGSNTQTSVGGAAAVAIAAFIVVLGALSFIPSA